MYHLLKGPILRLSVSFDDHSHLIGRKGASHKNLQAFSKTLIHFPERSSHSNPTESFVSSPFQGEDEVLVTPTELELKKEPCVPEMEDRLLEVFSSSLQCIRMNQLLIFTIPFQCPPALFSTVQNEIQKTIDSAKKNAISIYLSSPYPGLPEEHHRNVVVRGTVSNSKLVISVTNQITECLSDRLKLPVLKLTSTTRIPSTKWNDVIAKLSDNILKSQKLNKEGQLSSSCALDMYLQSIETVVKYDGKSLVTISAHDPGHILEVKTMLINALPINILIASNAVACKLDAETVGTLETFYSVKIGSNFGNSFGDSTTMFFGASAKRFFVGQKMALESNEGTVASMLEVKWLLSQSSLSFFLTTWCKMRKLWEITYPKMDYPACLQSPKNFIQMEYRSNQVLTIPSATPVPFSNFSAPEVRPPRIGRYNSASGSRASATVSTGPNTHRLSDQRQRHQPMPVASFEPMTAVASSAAGYPRRQQRPASEFTMMLEPRAAAAHIFESVPMPMASAAGMFEPIAAAAPMLEPRATATQHFEPLATAAPIHELRAAAAPNAEHFASSVLTPTTEPRFASGASALEPVTLAALTLEPTTASLVASSPEPQVNTGSSNEPRTLLVREFMPWLPSNENLAWQWQSWQATPSSAERSRDASSSDIFGSSPESNFWNHPASGTAEPTDLTPPDTSAAMPSK
ncbi:hypothetical protein BOX15_Mlig017380g1 [Macrostomum lignano]|uniref:K Homology domain-containing protein n=1 Tax=Macrostomum lignano TaxID=282301 RepID=A0A267DQC3_9PLAT|nr:hypothetical protein BOX15_Mlig017380g1 [Macrostomum lignano]